MRQRIKAFIKQTLFLNCTLYIYYNITQKLKFLTGNINTDSGATHATLSIDNSLEYIEDVFNDYKRISGRANFIGKLAELGPGDNEGVALMFLASGISKIDLADRFYSYRNIGQQKEIYNALGQKYQQVKEMLDNFDIVKSKESPKIKRHYGKDAAGEVFFDQHYNYDYIISRSVLEHTDNPLLVLQKMYDALNPGGMLIHKIDLKDHGMFTPYGHDTKFLEVPRCIYKLMVHGAGYPNRVLLHEYKQILKNLGGVYRILISGLYGTIELDREYEFSELPVELKQKSQKFIDRYKDKYAKEFKTIPTEDLMVSSFFLICEKPNFI